MIRSTDSSTAALPLVLMVAAFACAEETPVADTNPARIEITDPVPYGRQPIDYFGKTSQDAVSKSARLLASGDAHLTAESRHGFLLSVLELLDVPRESQVLVYSKTARSPDLVGPKSPRAIFFNDEVSVAWIPEARELELTAVDPIKGISFYTLSQPLNGLAEPAKPGLPAAAEESTPTFLRRDRCLACHAGRSSLEVPGLLLRAFQTDHTGKPIVGFSRVTHDMSYFRRWGGWYVTGVPAHFVHRGNLVSKEDNARHKREPGFNSDVSNLSPYFEASDYPYPSSDLVAHLVLAHQVHGTNLLIRAGLEARLNRRSDVETQLLRYLTFADEPLLDLSPSDAATILRASEFAASFVARGPRDDQGHSLRDLKLNGAVFSHRLSFLIHSRLFDALPEECRSRLLCRLWSGLNSETPDNDFQHLTSDERARIVRIVDQTVPRLPPCWQAVADSAG